MLVGLPGVFKTSAARARKKGNSMSKPIIAVNVGKSIALRKSVKEAACGYWRPKGKAQTSSLLQEAGTVLAVRTNVIVGAFVVQGVTQDPEDLLYEWDLAAAPSLAGLIGQSLLPEGTRWQQGDLSAWKEIDSEEFANLVEAGREDVIQLGPHTVRLRPDGSLEIGLAPAYELNVTSLAALPSSRRRIEAVVSRLAEAQVCTTYGAVAEMLSINSAQSVARSVVTNAAISAAEAAHVLPQKYRLTAERWVIPGSEPEWQTQGGDLRSRADILVDVGLGRVAEDGAIWVNGHDVITDGATLRRYLNV